MILILTTKRLICMNEMKRLVVCSFREVSLVQNEQEKYKSIWGNDESCKRQGHSSRAGEVRQEW